MQISNQVSLILLIFVVEVLIKLCLLVSDYDCANAVDSQGVSNHGAQDREINMQGRVAQTLVALVDGGWWLLRA
jgi:hypothetical protein